MYIYKRTYPPSLSLSHAHTHTHTHTHTYIYIYLCAFTIACERVQPKPFFLTTPSVLLFLAGLDTIKTDINTYYSIENSLLCLIT